MRIDIYHHAPADLMRLLHQLLQQGHDTMTILERLQASQAALALSVTALEGVVNSLPTNGPAFEAVASAIDGAKSQIDAVATKLSSFTTNPTA